LLRDGQTWDSIHLGILRDEWLVKTEGANLER
jgi:hypothetical protein